MTQKMKETTNKIQYQYEQLVGQLIKLPLSFTHFFISQYVMLVESSICRFNHVSVILIKTVIFFIFLDLT